MKSICAVVALAGVAAVVSADTISQVRNGGLADGDPVVIEEAVIINLEDTVNSGNSVGIQVRDSLSPYGAITLFGDQDGAPGPDILSLGFNVGDVVRIEGTWSVFAGLDQVNVFDPGSVTLVANPTLGVGANAIPINASDLIDFSPTGNELESQLVSLSGMTFADAGTPIPFGTGTYSISDGINTIDFRLQTNEIRDAFVAQVGPNFPTDPADIEGVVGQFTFGDPSEGFQIIPTNTTVIPAPGALALLGLGGLAIRRRR